MKGNNYPIIVDELISAFKNFVNKSLSKGSDILFKDRVMIGLPEKASTLSDGIYGVYKKKIEPLEAAYKFDYFYKSPPLTENEIKAKPVVLLLGQYSTGKTTFIQHVLGKEYPGGRIGPEPTTDRFVAVMHGSTDRIIPGNAAAIQSDKAFDGLAHFGANFLSKFQVSEMDSAILESCTFIDTPGVLSGDKQRLGRSYDFPAVCKWFARHSDLILLFFDAHKLDISDELKEVLEVLKPFEDKIKIILNKADQVDRSELLRVYGALMWSLGKVIGTPEVPRVFISASNDLKSSKLSLVEDEKDELFAELQALPVSSSTRKINDLVKRARTAKVHAIIINHLRNQLPMFGKGGKQQRLLLDLPAQFTQLHQEHGIPEGDFPDLLLFTEKLKEANLASFPKLSRKMLSAVDQAISIDVPYLMKKFPPLFRSNFNKAVVRNPFATSLQSIEELGDELWEWKVINVGAYKEIFDTLSPNAGKVSGSICREFFMQSGLSTEALRSLWKCADRDGDGNLNEIEFCVLMHLVVMSVQGATVPNTVVNTIFPPQ